MTTTNAIVNHCYGTAAAWTSADPTLLAGEVGWESDTGKAKLGDGTTAWSSLAYAIDFIPTSGLDDSTTATLDTATPGSLQVHVILPQQIQFTIGDGTNVISDGAVAFTRCFYACTITQADIVSIDSAGAAVSGSITVDIWKDTYANFPPTNTDTICASARPALSSASKATDSTLTGWTTAVAAGDCLMAVVEGAPTSCKQVIVTLKAVPTST